MGGSDRDFPGQQESVTILNSSKLATSVHDFVHLLSCLFIAATTVEAVIAVVRIQFKWLSQASVLFLLDSAILFVFLSCMHVEIEATLSWKKNLFR